MIGLPVRTSSPHAGHLDDITRAGTPVTTDPFTRLLQLAVGLVIVLLPVGGTRVPGLGLHTIFVAMAFPAGLAVLALLTDRVPLPRSVIFAGLGLGVAGGVVSAAQGVAPSESIELLVVCFLTLGYALAIVFAYRPGIEVEALDLLVVIGGVIAAIALASAGSMLASDAGTVVSGRLTGVFAQPNELGIFCAMLLPISVAALVTSRSLRRTLVLGAAAVCIVIAWALSMSRGAWIGGVVALICLAVCEPAVRRTLAAIGTGLLGICCLAVLLPANAPMLGMIGTRIRSLGDPAQNQYDDRPLIWAEAWRQATRHPWFGVGPGGYETAAGQSASATSMDPAPHPHDLVLTVLADRGVVGLAFGALVVVGCILAARHQMSRQAFLSEGPGLSRTRSMAVLAALVAVAAHGVFDMPLRNPIVAALVWTLLGLAILAEVHGRSRPTGSISARPTTGVARPW